MSKFSIILFLISLLIIGFAQTVCAGPTLEKVKASGSLPCGINTEEPEYSTQDAHCNHSAFDIDICKAVAQNFEILPDVIAKGPLASTYRLDDPQWAAIVNWTVEALIQA